MKTVKEVSRISGVGTYDGKRIYLFCKKDVFLLRIKIKKRKEGKQHALNETISLY